MRIGMLCHSGCGGSGRIATELSVELARRGHRVHLFTRTMPFGGMREVEGMTLHRNISDEKGPGPTILHTNWSIEESEALLSCILQVIAEKGLDILHFHYAVPFAAIVQRVKNRLRYQAPLLVGTLHGTDVTVHGRDPAVKLQLSRILRNLDGLTTVSVSHACLATKVFGLPTQPVVIPNFVRLSRFRRVTPSAEADLYDSESRPLSSPKDGAVITHISNFRPVKDPESVARIFLKVRRKMDCQLWLVGDGPEMQKVKSFAVRAGIQEDIRYLGLRRDVAPILARADLILFSSKSESFCLAALEAMACGVPVLATKVGGIPEVVVHGETGFLFPVGDHSMAAEIAVDLLSDPVRRRAMAKQSALHAGKFGHGPIVSSYENFCESLLHKSAARST